MTTLREAAQQALELLETGNIYTYENGRWEHCREAIRALRTALAQQGGWIPIDQCRVGLDKVDILMGDGSILCSVIPQIDGDLWWSGSGTGEKFIDPKYADVTHFRIRVGEKQ